MPKNTLQSAEGNKYLAQDSRQKGVFPKLSFLTGSKLRIIKECALQLLFPRVCPVCGEILKLPKKWYQMLTLDSESAEPVDGFRSIMICADCYQKLPLTQGPSCARCSRPLKSSEESLCDICKRESRFFDSGAAIWIHVDISRKIIYDLKFNNMRDNAELIGFEMALHAKEYLSLWQADVLIPVPLHKKRFIERGFNQAELIAEKLSFWLEKLYGIRIPVDSDFLLRTERTRPQRTLEASQRSKNVRSAFTVSTPSGAYYRSVILIDDIFTSGSTINACAKTLKESGTERVHFLAASIV